MNIRCTDRGFTLIEVMIVVVIIGILAAVAIPSMIRWLSKSKTQEAVGMVTKIYSGAKIYYLEHKRFPDSTGITPPLGTCCSNGDKCTPRTTYWGTEPWIALQFSVPDPHYFSYEFTTDGTSYYYARAYGDLDCDGKYSTFQMMGEINSQYADGPAGTAAIHKVAPNE